MPPTVTQLAAPNLVVPNITLKSKSPIARTASTGLIFSVLLRSRIYIHMNININIPTRVAIYCFMVREGFAEVVTASPIVDMKKAIISISNPLLPIALNRIT